MALSSYKICLTFSTLRFMKQYAMQGKGRASIMATAPSAHTNLVKRSLHLLCFLVKRQVTDLDVTHLWLLGPRIPFCATDALWGHVTSFS